jgi:hypothetical protein
LSFRLPASGPICRFCGLTPAPEAIGKLISVISTEKWIETYQQSHLMTKAGQADGKARRPIGEQGGRQSHRHKASAVNFPSILACLFK